ncbi:hypothetical protein RE428_21510 [Marinobacter nanhaiticus D15-8W]|uniref:DUF6160 domain-containing protein n=1 Tax=Marinobacter nanhaiticus D15-8W TaxID=626887 RepID=N6VUG0_9GAMM|nr:DUF6160 family protein [Marinobacter nanhaiticus]ENO13760.1 hypothetical protein J057_20230 [Marinobacter nanhaiticus D15-8W]BES71133.1 hypothetical protein RE428_21510 [Marinobacter nanhaiticus D15-8W]
MKGLKLKPLALCLALTPVSALAEIQALDDSQMGDVTGQAGVSIELETKVNIDEFRYIDEGTLAISDIEVGGTNRTNLFAEIGTNITSQPPSELLDNIRINIDVLADGDAVINILPQTFGAVDFRVSTGEWALRGTSDSTTILDNFHMDALIGSATLRVDTATDVLNFKTDIAIDDLEFDAPFIALGIRDLRLTGDEYDTDAPQPLRLFAHVEFDMYRGSRADGREALAIDLQAFRSDVTIGGVLVGGTSIGSVAMDNLVVSDTAMRIYGH